MHINDSKYNDITRHTLWDSNLFLLVILIKRKNFVFLFLIFLCLEKFFHHHFFHYIFHSAFFLNKSLKIHAWKSPDTKKRATNIQIATKKRKHLIVD